MNLHTILYIDEKSARLNFYTRLYSDKFHHKSATIQSKVLSFVRSAVLLIYGREVFPGRKIYRQINQLSAFLARPTTPKSLTSTKLKENFSRQPAKKTTPESNKPFTALFINITLKLPIVGKTASGAQGVKNEFKKVIVTSNNFMLATNEEYSKSSNDLQNTLLPKADALSGDKKDGSQPTNSSCTIS